jgi:molybdenum cofactor cytidylyltransferase
LAAGRSTRFGGDDGSTKLVTKIGSIPLVRRVADAALASRAGPIIVVTGHAAGAVEAALKDCLVQIVHAGDFAVGQSRSLQAGIAALPPSANGVVVLLGDMPLVSSQLIDRLIDTFDSNPGASAIVPTFGGRRGNPVVLARRIFSDVAKRDGDHGAGPLLKLIDDVIEVPVSSAEIQVDIDTPEDLQRAERQLSEIRTPPGV